MLSLPSLLPHLSLQGAFQVHYCRWSWSRPRGWGRSLLSSPQDSEHWPAAAVLLKQSHPIRRNIKRFPLEPINKLVLPQTERDWMGPNTFCPLDNLIIWRRNSAEHWCVCAEVGTGSKVGVAGDEGKDLTHTTKEGNLPDTE